MEENIPATELPSGDPAIVSNPPVKRLKHPAWTGVVLPIALAIAATFPLGNIRVLLLLAAVVAVTWTFHLTEYADRKFKKTAAAATIAVVLGMAVFFIGRAVDARAQTVDKAPHPPAPEVHVATTPDTKKAEPKEETKATTKPDTKRGYDRTHPPPPQPQATPKGGPLPPGGINGSQCNVIIQTGGQGNIATGGNCAPVAQVHKEWVLRNEIHAGAEDEADTSYPRYEIIKLEDGRMAVRSWKKS